MNSVPTTPQHPEALSNISAPEIDQYLTLYPAANRHILTANYNNGELLATLRHFPYPFTEHDLDYVTATQLTLYLSQLTYVLVAAALKAESYPDLPPHLISHYFSMMQAGRLFFVDLRQQMHRPIWKSDDVTATLRITRTRRTPTTLFAFIAFDINKRSCAGTLTVGTEAPA